VKVKKGRGSGTYDDERKENIGGWKERHGVEINSLCHLFVCICYEHDFFVDFASHGWWFNLLQIWNLTCALLGCSLSHFEFYVDLYTLTV
jgi:hypothetical protein